MVYKWNRQQIEYLIACVQQNDCIYNIKSPDYLDRTKKAQAFNWILEELRKVDGFITLEEIKRKWKNLRIQYMQERRAIIKSKKGGAAAEDIYVPKLWCFEQLDFLKTHSEIRSGRHNMGMLADDDEFCCVSETSNEEAPKRIEKKSTVNRFRHELDNFKAVLSERKREKPYAWLGALVASEMEEINPDDQPDAAWKVQCLMRKLTAQSRRKRELNSSKDMLQKILENTKSIIYLNTKPESLN